MAAPEILLAVGGDLTALNNAIDSALSRPRNFRGINANSFTEPLGRITGKASEFSKSMEASNARVLAFGASAGAIYAVHKSFETLLSSTIEVQKSMNLLGTLFNASNATLKNFSNSLFDVANLTGQSFRSATEAANTFARQGLSAAETLRRTRDALILARIAGMDFGDSARVITTAINSFNKEALTSTEIINALSAAETHFSVNSSDLAQAISRVGTSAENANVTLNETISLITSAAQITGRSGSVIGNSFKSIFTRLERPKVLEDLQQIGVTTRDASGNVLPLVQVLKNLASTYDLLTPSQKSFITEAVGGVYQINTLKAVLGDLGSGFSVYDRVLKTVEGSTSSVIDRNNQLNETISAKLNATLNNLIQAGSKVGNLVIAPSLGKGADLGANWMKGISEAIDSKSLGGDLARGLLKGRDVISGPGVQFITFAMLKLFQNLATFAAKSVGEFTGVSTKAKELELTQVQVLQQLLQQPKVLESIKTGTMTVDQAAKQVFRDIQAQNSALEAQLGLARLIAKTGMTGGVSVQGTKYRAASGYVPSFFDEFAMEEAHAKSLGAAAPRAHFGKGTIGGRKFIMNSQETEIPNFGSNGDSAVIPNYSKGFVPNLAVGREDILTSRDKLRKHTGRVASLFVAEKGAREYGEFYNVFRYSDKEKVNFLPEIEKFVSERTDKAPIPTGGRGAMSALAGVIFEALIRKKAQIGNVEDANFDIPSVRAVKKNLTPFFGDSVDGGLLDAGDFKISDSVRARKSLEKKIINRLDSMPNMKAEGHYPDSAYGPYGKTITNASSQGLPGMLEGAEFIGSGVQGVVYKYTLPSGKQKIVKIPRKQEDVGRLHDDVRKQRAFYGSSPDLGGYVNPNKPSLYLNYGDYKEGRGAGISELEMLTGEKRVNGLHNQQESSLHQSFMGRLKGNPNAEAIASRATRMTLSDVKRNFSKYNKVYSKQGRGFYYGRNGAVGNYTLNNLHPAITPSGLIFKDYVESNGQNLIKGHLLDGVAKAYSNVGGYPDMIRGIRESYVNPNNGQVSVYDFADGYIPRSDLYSLPWRQRVRGHDRPVPPTETADRFREYETYLLQAGLPKLGFEGVHDLNSVLGTNSRADFFARRSGVPHIVDAKGGYNDAQPSDIAAKEESFAMLKQNPKFLSFLRSQGIVNPDEVREAIVFGNMGHGQRKKLAETGKLMMANGFMPNLAGLSFQQSFDKEFGITKLTGTMGGKTVGDIEYSGNDEKEIEGFEINKAFRGKGLAKKFYKALGRGRVSGTLLPQFGNNGNAFFPQLSRARMAKSATVQGFDGSEMTVAQFEKLVQMNSGNQGFWNDNSFNLISHHAQGFVPNLVDPGYISSTLERIKNGTSGFSDAEKAMFLKKFAGKTGALGSPFGVDILGIDDLPPMVPFWIQNAARKKYGKDAYVSVQPHLAEKLRAAIKQDPSIVHNFSALEGLFSGGIAATSFAQGFVPNFSNPLTSAINRERAAGYSSSQIRVGHDSALVSAMNPDGVGVYNSTEGSLSNGIGLARRAGIDPKTKGMAKGNIPNFADVGTSMALGGMQFLLAIPLISGALQKMTSPSKQAAEAMEKLEGRITKLTKVSAQYDSRLEKTNQSYEITMKAIDGLYQKAAKTGYLSGAEVSALTMLEGKAAKEEGAMKLYASGKSRAELQKTTSLSELISEQKKTTFGQKLFGGENYEKTFAGKAQGFGLVAGMGAGIGMNVAGEMIGGDKGKALGEFGSTIQTAGQVMATIPGPAGLVAGALVVMKGAIDFADKAAWGFAEKIKDAAQEKLTGIDNMDAASNGLAQAMSNYQTLLDDSHATNTALLKAQEKYKTALNNFVASGFSKDDITKVTGAGTMSERQAALQELNEKNAREKEKQTTISQSADLAESIAINTKKDNVFNQSLFSWGGMGNFISGRKDIDGIESLWSGKAGKSIFDEKFSKEGGGNNLLTKMTQEAMDSGDSKGYIADMKEKGVLDDQSAGILSRNIQATKKYVTAAEEMGKIIDQNVGQQRAQQQSMERYAQGLKQLQNELRTFAGDAFFKQMDNISERMKSGANARHGDAEIAGALALSLTKGGGVNRNGIIMNSDEKALTEIDNTMAKIGADMDVALSGVNANFTKGLTDLVKGEFAGAKGGANGNNQATFTNEQYNTSAQIINQITQDLFKNGKLNGSAEQTRGTIANAIDARGRVLQGADPGISALLRQSANSLVGSKGQELIQQQLLETQKVSTEYLEQTAKATIESKDKLQQMINQRILAAGGGVSSFTQDFGASYRRSLRQDISESRSGVPEMAGVGAINFLKKAKNDLGIGEGDALFTDMKAKAITGVESELKKTYGVYARQGYNTPSDAGIHDIASRQVENEVGGASVNELMQKGNDLQDKANGYLVQILERNGMASDQTSRIKLQNDLFTGKGITSFQNQSNVAIDSQVTRSIDYASMQMMMVAGKIEKASENLKSLKGEIDITITQIKENDPAGKRTTRQSAILESVKSAQTKAPSDVYQNM